MDFLEIKNVLAGGLEGKKVQLRGWVHHKRSSGGIQFLLLRDGTNVLQCTLKKDKVKQKTFESLKALPIESTIELTGVVKKDFRAPNGYEISIDGINVIHAAEKGFPVAKKYHGPDFLLDHRHLWIRSKKLQSIMRVRAKLLDAAREWFKVHGFTEVQMPTLIMAACEGGSTLFEVKYFDKRAYLTQSWQLYAEAVIASLGKIYTIAPSFRAEKSKTRRHLTEYCHLEAEVPWCDLEGIIEVQEGLMTHICQTICNEATEELEELGRDPKDLLMVRKNFPRITYDKAVKTLQRDGVKISWGEDLGWKQEQHLTLKFKRPFFVTHYPKQVKAFYHKPDTKREEVTLSVDMLAPEGYGEVTGGGQRIEDLNELLRRMEEEKLDPKDYEWYIDLRRYGSVPHSGFGLGVERVLTWICKLEHIRDAVAFPRLINRLYP